MRRVSVVVPCFNEAHRLDVDAFRGARLDGCDLELVFVDDGSTDATATVLEALCNERPAQLRLVRLKSNAGKAEAVRRGVVDALERSPDAVGYLDADLATPLSELPPFVDVLARNPEINLVLGSRVKLLGRIVERRAWRHYLGRAFATAAAVVLDMGVYDTQCGAKLLRVTPDVRRVFETPFLSRWIFDVELIARYLTFYPGSRQDAERSIYELPLRRWIDVGGSKVKAKDFAKAALDLAMIQRRYPRAPRS